MVSRAYFRVNSRHDFCAHDGLRLSIIESGRGQNQQKKHRGSQDGRPEQQAD
jgi:hypothetical protein